MEGKELLGWSDTTLSQPIDDAIAREIRNTAIARKFLPLAMGACSNNETVPSEKIIINDDGLTVDTTKPTNITEIQALFTLRETLVTDEAKCPIIGNAAVKATNAMAQAEDMLIFQGEGALAKLPLLRSKVIKLVQAPDDNGLLSNKDPKLIVHVKPVKPNSPGIYGNNTARAVADAYSRLQGGGHYGPYVLVLPTAAYADFITPIENTSIIPAEIMKWIVTIADPTTGQHTVHFYGTGTLPADTGVLLSIGGNTMDLVQSSDKGATLKVLSEKGSVWPFMVHEYLALRLKDETAVVQLKFE